MKVEIDMYSGFCFGVVYAIKKAEEELSKFGKLYCLGDIVHNNLEVERLKLMGLITIDYEEFKNLHNCPVLIRAHGEPPNIYSIAHENNITLIDATCPVVLRLQHHIKIGSENMASQNGQIVIYGKKGHAEVNGLVGQTDGKAIVVGSVSELNKIDFSKPITIFSQTTQNNESYRKIISEIKRRMEKFGDDIVFISHDSTCRQVSSRQKRLREFCKKHDVIIFVSGKKSSNGKVLFHVCLEENPRTYFVSESIEIDKQWFRKNDFVGICGATSTPLWLMEKIAGEIEMMYPRNRSHPASK
ncbi:MAG: 4-hydroxy-3-methylbut-2-enyl diphosphate reductase [Bacteroidetes bacterium CG23_combo_of_CG06-09_8_20_14_all_32_9]|nr:MAG: 4-hydroxy-3-methylbut-2-enyl diphosphate reductase [Bacteroidetes bacterium CG23_combo_of_CG06-09_8_20_14_all_32_9]